MAGIHNDCNYVYLLTDLDYRATLLLKFSGQLIVNLNITSGFAVPLSHIKIETLFTQGQKYFSKVDSVSDFETIS